MIGLTHPLRIIGTGRCGTSFMVIETRKRGLELGHDRLNRDGACGLAWCDPEPFRCKTDTLPLGEFKYTWHLVRHPLACIASIYHTKILHHFWPWIGTKIDLPADPLKRAMVYWLRWNEKCEPLADIRLRIEDMGGVPVFAREHPDLTWEDLGDSDLTLAIKDKAREYGY